jgi:uncharacterized protein YggE
MAKEHLMTTRNVFAFVLAAGLLAGVRSAAAADGAGPSVSSMGTATVEKQPQFIRMTTDLQVEAPTLKEALAKLKTRRGELQASLTKLGGIEKSIEVGEPRLADAAGGDRREQMMRMMRQRMGATRPAAAAGGGGAGKTVTVSANVRCDWPLQGEGAEGILVAATDLQEKIKAAKLFEAPKSAAKAEEEEEAMAEMRGDEGPKPGEMVFLYVAKISEAEESKAAAEAFGKAKESAARLAKAAGATLGTLRTITSQANDMSAFGEEYGYGRYGSYAQRYMAQMARQGGETSGERESLAAQPGKITHQVFVSTTFEIK